MAKFISPGDIKTFNNRIHIPAKTNQNVVIIISLWKGQTHTKILVYLLNV